MDFPAKNNNLRATMGGVSRWGTRRGTLTAPLMAMVGVLVCSPSVLYPPGRDQSVFLLAGQALSGGAIPYRDFWDIKPPGLFLAYLLPGSLASAWPGAAALVDLAALAVAILACHRLLAGWGSAVAGPAAAIFLTGLWAFAGDWWDLGQGERLAVPLLILALLAAGRASTRRWLLAGTCIGVMTLLKTSFLPLALVLLPLLPRRADNEDRNPAPAGRLLGAAVVGTLAPLILVALALAIVGALDAAREATVSFTGHYTRLAWQRPEVVLRTAWVTTWAFLQTTWPLVGLAAVATAMALLRPGSLMGMAQRNGNGHVRPDAGLTALQRGVTSLLVALLLAAAAVLAQGKFFPYHWIALWPALALLAALGAGGLAQLATRGWGSPPAATTAAATMLALLALIIGLTGSAPGWPGWSASLARGTGRLQPDAHLATFRVQGMGYEELVRTARQVATVAPADEPILLWGFEPAFYLYAQRSFPGRFPFAYPLITPWAPGRWQDEFLAAFDASPPSVIVVRRRDPIPWVAGVGGDAARRLQLFPRLVQRLERDYQARPQISSPHLEVWQRVAAPAARR